MKNYCFAAIGMVAIALGLAPAATAAETSVGLDFSLSPSTTPEKVDADHATAPKPLDGLSVANSTQVTPLAVPSEAPAAPLGSESKPTDTAKLPPPPETVTAQVPTQVPTLAPVPVAEPPTQLAIVPPAAPQPPLIRSEQTASSSRTSSPAPSQAPSPAATNPATPDGILSFEQDPISTTAQATINPLVQSGFSVSLQAFAELDALFHGGTNSLVARAVGSAEGTRTPDGGRTRAYQGHVDPGNGVWNLGTFSYQHGATSPEEADQRQLRRLRNQALALRQAAQTKGLQLTLEEELNGIDLANQSPRAALSRGGYIDRLHQARDMGLQGTEAVLWARTRSYLDPDSGRWNAPGLGNNVYSITHDQERRLRAIARALSASPPVAPAPITVQRQERDDYNADLNTSQNTSQAEANANLILSLDLAP